MATPKTPSTSAPDNPLIRILLSFADTQAWNFASGYFGPIDQAIANTLKKLAVLPGSPGGATVTRAELKIACDVAHNMILWADDMAEEMNKLPYFSWLTVDDKLADSIRAAGVILLGWSQAGWSLVHYQAILTYEPPVEAPIPPEVPNA